jgi:hypothetical protein
MLPRLGLPNKLNMNRFLCVKCLSITSVGECE